MEEIASISRGRSQAWGLGMAKVVPKQIQHHYTALVTCRGVPTRKVPFLPARRYASAGNSDRNVSVCLSVCHAPVLCQKEES